MERAPAFKTALLGLLKFNTIASLRDSLLQRLPKSGDTWPKAQRKLWLQLLEGSFDLIYLDKDESAPGAISKPPY